MFVTFLVLFLFEKLQPDTLDMYNGLSQFIVSKQKEEFISIKRIKFRLVPLQVLNVHDDLTKKM